MAKQISVIQFAGKMGNAIGRRSRKGNPILGLDQGKYHNPNTQKQIEARTKFLGLCNAAGIFANCMVGLTLYAKANGWSLRNAFMKVNKGAVTVALNGGVVEATLQPENLVLSTGSLEVIGGIEGAEQATGGGWDVTTIHDDTHATRLKHVVLYDVESKKAFMKIVPYSQEVVHFDFDAQNRVLYYYEADAPDAGTAVAYSAGSGQIMATAEFRALANQMVYSGTVFKA